MGAVIVPHEVDSASVTHCVFACVRDWSGFYPDGGCVAWWFDSAEEADAAAAYCLRWPDFEDVHRYSSVMAQAPNLVDRAEARREGR